MIKVQYAIILKTSIAPHTFCQDGAGLFLIIDEKIGRGR